MLIKGYDAGPLVPGESLLVHPGFWSNYLLAMCSDGECPERWFQSGSARTAPMSMPCPRSSSILSAGQHSGCRQKTAPEPW